MPYSSPIFASEVELYFREVRPSSVPEIGTGEGKYGEMLRRVQPNTRRPCRCTSSSTSTGATRRMTWKARGDERIKGYDMAVKEGK